MAEVPGPDHRCFCFVRADPGWVAVAAVAELSAVPAKLWADVVLVLTLSWLAERTFRHLVQSNLLAMNIFEWREVQAVNCENRPFLLLKEWRSSVLVKPAGDICRQRIVAGTNRCFGSEKSYSLTGWRIEARRQREAISET